MTFLFKTLESNQVLYEIYVKLKPQVFVFIGVRIISYGNVVV